MNSDPQNLELARRYLDGTATADEIRALEEMLRTDAAFRRQYLRYTNVDAALGSGRLATARIVQQSQVAHHSAWFAWRPLTAMAAGIVFGMLCTSVVYGFVSPRLGAMKKLVLAVFDPGLENSASIVERGVPRSVGQWGADSATVVPAEKGVQPLEGTRMLRLDPIPREKNVKNLASRVYQVLDLRSVPLRGIAGDVEVQVTASFCAAKSDVTSRYLIRAFALNETPEQATKGFWPKSQDDGVVSVAQRFETSPGDRRWHTFSLKMPLPRGAQSLVFILGAMPPDDASAEAPAHYLDDVQVSVLIPQAALR